MRYQLVCDGERVFESIFKKQVNEIYILLKASFPDRQYEIIVIEKE